MGYGVDVFLSELSTLSGASPVAAIAVAAHGVQAGDSEYPIVLASDTTRLTECLESEGFDVRGELIQKLNQIRPIDGGNLRSVLIFDCCRQNSSDDCWRGVQALP